MARLDKIHHAVKNALIKDGWEIIADPYWIKYEDLDLYADLAADRMPFAAERGNQKIVVEAKSFLGRSPVQDLKVALGQYGIYRVFLAELEPDRKLYLAIAETTYRRFFNKKAVQFIVAHEQLPLIVVNVKMEEIVSWIN